MNTPKTAQENPRGNKLKKIAAGTALFGVLTSCGPNEWNKNTSVSENFTPDIEQVDDGSFKQIDHLKAPESIDKVFKDYIATADNHDLFESIDNVRNTYYHLESLLGKNIFPVRIESVPGDIMIYCSSAEEAQKIIKRYKNNTSDTTDMENIQETAVSLESFNLTPDHLEAIVRDYAQNPMVPLSERDIWIKLFE